MINILISSELQLYSSIYLKLSLACFFQVVSLIIIIIIDFFLIFKGQMVNLFFGNPTMGYDSVK